MQVETLFIGLICLIPVALGFGALGWKIYHNTKSDKAAVRLGDALGLEKISQTNNPKNAWYGGVADDRYFAVKPVSMKRYYYDGGRRRASLDYYLRIVLEVNVDKPLDVVVYRSPQEGGGAETFAEAFPTIKNISRLTASAQNALLAFAQKGYETGLQGTTLRTDKGVRNLTLRDRASVPEVQLSSEVLADAQVILAHDHPKPNLDAAELNEMLAEMTAVARTIEPASKRPSTQREKPRIAPGTIGDVSSRIGYDVRDLLMAGFDHQDIAELEIGSITLQELFERGPSKK